MPVSTTHTLYDKMKPRWDKMTDVCADEEWIHDKTTIYLSKLDGQTDDQYTAYKGRASFVPFTSRIVKGFTGMVMRKPVMVSGTDNKKVENWLNNVDGKGSSFNLYTGKLISEYLQYTRCGTLVEMPKTDQVLSLADAEANGIMPKFVFYSAYEIINWKTAVIDNTEKLTMVVLQEEIADENEQDEFTPETVARYRVLDLDGAGFYRQRVFDNNNNLESEIWPRMAGQMMKFIPFIIHGGVTPQFPELIGIADLNLHHYRKDADYSHGLHFTALPTPYRIGVDPDEAPVTIGPEVAWDIENENAKVGMLEFSGKGLGEVARKMEVIIEQIVMLTSRILSPQQVSNETALGAAIRSSNETSTLAGQVSILTNDLEWLFKAAMRWYGVPGYEGFTAEINKDFIPIQLSGADAMAYMTNWLKGTISYDTLFDIYKKGELIPADRDIEDEKKAIAAEDAVRMAREVEIAEKLGKAQGDLSQSDGLADEAQDNNFK